jgi:hypothetical protein
LRRFWWWSLSTFRLLYPLCAVAHCWCPRRRKRVALWRTELQKSSPPSKRPTSSSLTWHADEHSPLLPLSFPHICTHTHSLSLFLSLLTGHRSASRATRTKSAPALKRSAYYASLYQRLQPCRCHPSRRSHPCRRIVRVTLTRCSPRRRALARAATAAAAASSTTSESAIPVYEVVLKGGESSFLLSSAHHPSLVAV